MKESSVKVEFGGGHAEKRTKLSEGWGMGDNANAWVGGCRPWEKTGK